MSRYALQSILQGDKAPVTAKGFFPFCRQQQEQEELYLYRRKLNSETSALFHGALPTLYHPAAQPFFRVCPGETQTPQGGFVTKKKPVVIILDDNKERCLREEAALEKAIEARGIYAVGISNYGKGHISRSGVDEEKLPCIEIEGLYYYPPRPQEELTYERLCRFLDTIAHKGILQQLSGVPPTGNE